MLQVKLALIENRIPFVILRNSIFLLLLVIGIIGCATIAPFDQTAFDQDVILKNEALSLIDYGIDDFSSHEQQVTDFLDKVEKAYEYEKTRANNEITVQMWEVLKDPNKNLLGGYFKFWQEKGKLSQDFVAEKKKTISSSFDQIIQLEAGKKR